MSTKRKTIDAVRAAVEAGEYALLSTVYVNNKAPLEFRCSEGHVYRARFNDFQGGKRCPRCKAEAFGRRASEANHLRLGPLSPRWNPERTDEERASQRKTYRDIQWRRAVWERDGYACLCCGDRRGGNLVAHHIFAHADFPQVRHDVRNGVTLCEDCHVRFHREYGFGGNTADQLADFMPAIAAEGLAVVAARMRAERVQLREE